MLLILPHQARRASYCDTLPLQWRPLRHGYLRSYYDRRSKAQRSNTNVFVSPRPHVPVLDMLGSPCEINSEGTLTFGDPRQALRQIAHLLFETYHEKPLLAKLIIVNMTAADTVLIEQKSSPQKGSLRSVMSAGFRA